MRVTRKMTHFSLAFALLATAAAVQPGTLRGQETHEFEVLTGREISGSGSRSFVPISSPGNQFDGVSVRRHRARTRPVSHPNVAQFKGKTSYVPRHQRVIRSSKIGDTSVLKSAPGEVVYEDIGGVMPAGEPCLDGSCGVGGCGDCGDCGDAQCVQCIPCPRFSLKNMQFILGAQGFLSPRDMMTAGTGQSQVVNPTHSFGFHGGVNWGFHLPCFSKAFAFQLGGLLVSSNYDGELSTYDQRSQMFLTGGIYRRVDWGLQGGVVLDYVNDEWYVDHELIQIRGELSWVFQNCFEFGFNFAGSTRTSETFAEFSAVFPGVEFPETREALDYYRFFARQRFKRGGEGSIFAGWTEDGDGLVGADVTVPISCDWGVRGGFAYVSPQADDQQLPRSNADFDNELWNVSVSLIWYPGGFDDVFCRYNRPLFNVADNGTFLQKIIRE